jgi:signal transduction histidine kinase
MLALSGTSGSERPNDAIALMSDLHRRISDLLREMPSPVTPNLERLGIAGALRQVAEGELKGALDEVRWEIDPEAETHAAALAPITAEVLYYAAREAMRNAARYGRRSVGDRPLILTITLTLRDGIHLTIEDNGDGIDPSRPTDGGSGQGLALHGTMMAIVGGTLTVESMRDQYTRVVLSVNPFTIDD